jgi:hypothetical protein
MRLTGVLAILLTVLLVLLAGVILLSERVTGEDVGADHRFAPDSSC